MTPCSPLIGHRGREAVLSCTVTRLRDFKVGWVKVRENLLKYFLLSKNISYQAGDQTILSLHKRVITHNDRIHITHDEHDTWNLHIRWTQG